MRMGTRFSTAEAEEMRGALFVGHLLDQMECMELEFETSYLIFAPVVRIRYFINDAKDSSQNKGKGFSIHEEGGGK
ncbi:hypothetical protein ACLOJK_010585 [Asimina triloba]